VSKELKVYAFYSAQAVEKIGTVFYEDSNRGLVEITMVHSVEPLTTEVGRLLSKQDQERLRYYWSDIVYLGEVVKYSGKGRKGSNPRVHKEYVKTYSILRGSTGFIKF
jgi:hypothetical protein